MRNEIFIKPCIDRQIDHLHSAQGLQAILTITVMTVVIIIVNRGTLIRTHILDTVIQIQIIIRSVNLLAARWH